MYPDTYNLSRALPLTYPDTYILIRALALMYRDTYKLICALPLMYPDTCALTTLAHVTRRTTRTHEQTYFHNLVTNP